MAVDDENHTATYSTNEMLSDVTTRIICNHLSLLHSTGLDIEIRLFFLLMGEKGIWGESPCKKVNKTSWKKYSVQTALNI